MTGKVTGAVLADSKRLLSLMGIPWLEALEDGEAQASFMAAKGDVWAVGSKDYDCLLFGAPILARYMTLTGREYLPAKKTSRPLTPELVNLADNLEMLGISREQLVDLALLVGTDFNEGVMGIGPKKGLALVRKYGAAEKFPDQIRSGLPDDLDEVRNIFLHPHVLENYSLKLTGPDRDGIIDFLCNERAFARDRVEKVADRLVESRSKFDSQLGRWIG
jgi:flap endonuclease-1